MEIEESDLHQIEVLKNENERLRKELEDLDKDRIEWLKEYRDLAESVRENEERLRVIFNNAAIGIVEVNEQGRFVSANDRICEMLGYTRDEILEKTVLELTADEDRNRSYEINKKICSGYLQMYNYEKRYIKKDQTLLWVHVTVSGVYDSNGLYIKSIGTIEDISGRKKFELALQEVQERFRLLADNISQMVWITDKDGNFIWFNKRWFDFTGVSLEEMQLGGHSKVNHPTQSESVLNSYEESVKQGKPWKETYMMRSRNGEYRWFLSQMTPIFDDDGIITLWFGTSTDITDQKKAEEALRQQNIELKFAKEKAEESDRLKSAFLANMSHEIRTPMNGILGFADLLSTPDLSEESQKMYIETINHSGKRMLDIINDLIDISKIEAGFVEVKNEIVNVPGILEELVLFFTPEAKARGVNLSLNMQLVRERYLLNTDKTKLSQVISNLIKNALKFTPSNGTIELGCTIQNEDQILFYVKDTGVGIRKEIQEKIFERFRQGDKKDENEGVGLGLAISKAYVEMLQGRIWLESEPGKGSTFFFTIPADTMEMEQKEAYEENGSSSIPSVSILIAEDDETSYILLNEILKRQNIKTYYARNGLEAVRIAEAQPDLNLVLMDIRMPVMNGIEAIHKIKEIKPDLPIIAQSAFAIQEEIQNAFDAGVDDYITKPIDIKNLLIKIASVISS